MTTTHIAGALALGWTLALGATYLGHGLLAGDLPLNAVTAGAGAVSVVGLVVLASVAAARGAARTHVTLIHDGPRTLVRTTIVPPVGKPYQVDEDDITGATHLVRREVLGFTSIEDRLELFAGDPKLTDHVWGFGARPDPDATVVADLPNWLVEEPWNAAFLADLTEHLRARGITVIGFDTTTVPWARRNELVDLTGAIWE